MTDSLRGQQASAILDALDALLEHRQTSEGVWHQGALTLSRTAHGEINVRWSRADGGSAVTCAGASVRDALAQLIVARVQLMLRVFP